MGKLRFYLALWAAKLSRPLLKITRHNGTNFPGELAIRLCPDFLRFAGKPRHVIAVTGTNGKTTVCNLLLDAMEGEQGGILHNRAGSNINTGIATALVRGADLFGRCRYEWGVFEVDERWSPKIFPYVRPEWLLVTNLSRDSVPRNAHPEFIAGLLSGAVPEGTKLILNADDLISCSLAPENPRAYFGLAPLPGDVVECRNRINDVRICPVCQGKLRYEYRRYHHIGKARCEACGYASPEYDYTGRDVDPAGMEMSVSDAGGEGRYPLFSDSVFNIYNEVAVAALLRELGWSHEKIAGRFSSVHIVESRFNVHEAGGMRIVMQMSKDMNAYACSRAFDYVAELPGEKEIVLMLRNSNDIHDQTENVCWMFDCDFELLRREEITRIVVAGRRSRDLVLRLLLAGIGRDRIVRVDEEMNAPEALEYRPGLDVYLFYGTDSLPLVTAVRDEVERRAKEALEA